MINKNVKLVRIVFMFKKRRLVYFRICLSLGWLGLLRFFFKAIAVIIEGLDGLS